MSLKGHFDCENCCFVLLIWRLARRLLLSVKLTKDTGVFLFQHRMQPVQGSHTRVILAVWLGPSPTSSSPRCSPSCVSRFPALEIQQTCTGWKWLCFLRGFLPIRCTHFTRWELLIKWVQVIYRVQDSLIFSCALLSPKSSFLWVQLLSLPRW